MSPIRLLIKHPEGELRVIQCMLSKDDIGRNIVYVIEKNMIVTTNDEDSPLDYRNVAYRMATRGNSTILDSAKINYCSNDMRYVISDLSVKCHTLTECLYAKLFDWCAKNKVTILGII